MVGDDQKTKAEKMQNLHKQLGHIMIDLLRIQLIIEIIYFKTDLLYFFII